MLFGSDVHSSHSPPPAFLLDSSLVLLLYSNHPNLCTMFDLHRNTKAIQTHSSSWVEIKKIKCIVFDQKQVAIYTVGGVRSIWMIEGE